ncbi:uncharacterized protein EV422DRAFT_95970 [Fimicolochytrium jonesii]|uniref:uncharacterized protein n=1 Tax=Fimicolochytrium jonesii TaxID=1396493 RepID=UPI0022FE2B24|nr:uncharacterized protein EV422DRAFT_95970 [Fimicolochytrium jonesii]KAI8820033.1 hypothetical protein EV422DRAFT_95970 [Fimicolochytrium jonesii]
MTVQKIPLYFARRKRRLHAERVRAQFPSYAVNAVFDANYVTIAMLFTSTRTPSEPFFAAIHKYIYDVVCPAGFRTSSQWKPLWDHLKRLRSGEVTHNIKGTFLAILSQTLENRAVLAMEQFFQSKSLDVGALIFDGLLLRKERDVMDLELLCIYNVRICEGMG